MNVLTAMIRRTYVYHIIVLLAVVMIHKCDYTRACNCSFYLWPYIISSAAARPWTVSVTSPSYNYRNRRCRFNISILILIISHVLDGHLSVTPMISKLHRYWKLCWYQILCRIRIRGYHHLIARTPHHGDGQPCNDVVRRSVAMHTDKVHILSTANSQY